MNSRSTISTPAGSAPPSAQSAARPRPRIALAHDWICGYRGGEAVLERIAALAQSIGDIAGVYVMFDDGRPLSVTVDSLRREGRIHPSSINSLPGAQQFRRWMLPLYPRAVDSLSAKLAAAHAEAPIDLLISTSSAAIKGLRSPAGVPHICYCHSPARYIWSQGEQYQARGLSPASHLRALGLRAYAGRFKRWDRRTAGHVSTFVANSSATAALIDSAYGRDSTVIHPPVRTEFFIPDSSGARQDFWLVVSALEPYKRIDLAIAASRLAGKTLVISGKGSAMAELRQQASTIAADVDFRGRTSDEELRNLYRSAALLLFPQVEDFGIVAVEAQACGLPVVARRAGGALDIIREGQTGAFFDEAAPESVIAAAERIPTDAAEACRANALRFSEGRFDEQMLAMIRQHLPAYS